MFIAALFTTAKTWRQPKSPSKDEWVKKMWYRYTVEYYSAIKKERSNTIYSNMDGPGVFIILSEVGHTEKDKYHMISLICGL